MDHPLGTDTRLLAGRLLEQSAFALLLVLATIFAFEHRQPFVKLGPIVLTNAETIIILLITFWLLARLITTKPLHFPGQLWLPLILWLAALTLSTVAAPAFHDKALLFMGRIVAGILIGLAVYDLVTTPGRRWMVIIALVSGVVIMALLGLAEGFGVTPVVSWLDGFKYAPTRVGDLLRISATLSYATITAMVLEMILPLLLVLVVIARRSSLRILAIVGIVFVLAAHVLTLSRAGFLTLLIVLVLMAFAGWRRGRPKIIAVSIGAAILLVGFTAIVLLVNPTARLRLTTETEQAWYQVQYQSPESVQAAPGELLTVPVQITNVGQRSWSPDGELFFALSYHLTADDGSSVTYDGERSLLPVDVAPGETATVSGLIRAPDDPGNYLIEWDMVQESVTWFSWKEAPTSASKLVVEPGLPVQGNAISRSQPPTDVRVTNPTPGRIDLWQAALQMAADYPILGVGPDSFRWQYGAYANVDKWDTGIHANNLYLESLADTGIIGLLAFLWFSWRLLRLGLSNLRGPSQRSSWLISLALVAGLAAWYLHGFFDYFYEFTPTYVLFWIMVGLLASLTTGKRGWNARRF